MEVSGQIHGRLLDTFLLIYVIFILINQSQNYASSKLLLPRKYSRRDASELQHPHRHAT
jgi:hypothetical protein